MIGGINNSGFLSTTNLLRGKGPQRPDTPPMGDGMGPVNASSQAAGASAVDQTNNANTDQESGINQTREERQTNPSTPENAGRLGDVNDRSKASEAKVPSDAPVPPEVTFSESDGTKESRAIVNPQPRQKTESPEAGSKLQEKSSTPAPTPETGELPKAEGISMRKPQGPPGLPPAPTPGDPSPDPKYKPSKTQRGIGPLKSPSMAPKIAMPKLRLPKF